MKTPRTAKIIEKYNHVLQWNDLLGYCREMTRNSQELEKELDIISEQKSIMEKALMSIEDHFINGADTYEAWIAMGGIAQQALETIEIKNYSKITP
jgi:hypothetical protein